MFMYNQLTSVDVQELRRERVRSLEADHCRYTLQLEENPEDKFALEQLAEIERRIEVHCGPQRNELPEPAGAADPLPEEEGKI